MKNTLEQDNNSAINTIDNLLQNWWKITLCAVIFGLVGLAFSFFNPPKYQAEALFSATIDFRQINYENLVNEAGLPLRVTQYDKDLAISVVPRALLKVRSSVIDYARTLDPNIDGATFVENSALERLHDRWRLLYRHEDPQVAMSIVNYWADVGMVQLENEQAEETFEPYVIVDLIARAHLPQEPLYQNRNNLIFAGTIIGFFVGVLVIDTRNRYFSASKHQQSLLQGD